MNKAVTSDKRVTMKEPTLWKSMAQLICKETSSAKLKWTTQFREKQKEWDKGKLFVNQIKSFDLQMP